MKLEKEMIKMLKKIKNEKEKAETKKEEKIVETSVKKTRMNPTGKNIDLDNLLFDDD